MTIKLELSITTGKIYVASFKKNGKPGNIYVDVTDQATWLSIQRILHFKMHGDCKETLEFTEPFLKGGKPYHIEITLTPIEQMVEQKKNKL